MSPNDPNVALVEIVADSGRRPALRRGRLVRVPPDRDGHGLEDLVAVIDGRGELQDECLLSPPELRAYLADQFTTLLRTPAFVDALLGHLPGDEASQRRFPGLIRSLQTLAGLART